MIEIFGWIAVVCALTGCVLNNRKMILCFWFWMVSNVICAHLHVRAVDMEPLYWRDVAFFVLAVVGYYKWRKPTKQG